MKKKIAVIGVGTAGIQSLCHFLAWLSPDWEVTSIHDPEIPIVGIGESTNPTFIAALERGTNFSMIKDLKLLDATQKYGTEYFKWREKSFLSPLLGVGNGTAIHLNTFWLKNFAFPRFRSIWNEKFKEIQGNILEIKNFEDFVSLKINNKEYSFDYVIDCTGFPKEYSNYTISKNETVNEAIVHDLKLVCDNPFGPYTTGHTATKNGWMFTVPILSRTSYGYLFNNKITTFNEAKKDFEQILNVKLNNNNIVRYSFISYYANNLLTNRVFVNGNKAAFFEPMFANSLFIYDNVNRLIYDYIVGNSSKTKINEKFETLCKDVESLIAFHYHGGSTFNTKFWNNAIKSSKKTLEESEKLNEIIPFLKKVKKEKNGTDLYNTSWVFSSKSLFILDENFQYNYFRDKE